jgi:hypothetical protein
MATEYGQPFDESGLIGQYCSSNGNNYPDLSQDGALRSQEASISPGESLGAVSNALHEAHEVLADQRDPAMARSPLRQHGGLALADSLTPLRDGLCITPLKNTEYDHFDIQLSNLTKACFIEKLFELTQNDENQVMAYRSHQAVIAKPLDGCPTGRLMTRKSTANSSSVSKYVYDCYTLYMFIRGDTSGDIEKVFSRTLRCAQTTTDSTHTGDTSSLFVRNALIEIQSELSALKTCVAETESLKETVLTQNRLIDTLRADCKVLQTKVVTLEHELNTKCTRYDALGKLNNERLDSLEEAATNDGKVDSVGAELSRLYSMHGCLAKKVKDHISVCHATDTARPPDTPGREQSSPILPSTSRRTPPPNAATAVTSPPAQSPTHRPLTTHKDLINTDTGQSTVPKSHNLPHDVSVNQINDGNDSVVIRDHSTTESDMLCIKCHNETSGAHRCDVCKQHIHVICGTQIGEEGYGSSVRCDLCSVGTSRESYSSKLTNGVSRGNYTDTGTHRPSKATPGSKSGTTALIPVVINRYVPDARSKPGEAGKYAQRDDDVDRPVINDESMFEGVGRKGRTRRYYVGGIKSNSTRQGICNYLEHKNIHPTAVRVMSSGRGCLAAKLTVPSFEGVSLEDKQFWPSGVYCRRWYGETAWRGSHTQEKDDVNPYL